MSFKKSHRWPFAIAAMLFFLSIALVVGARGEVGMALGIFALAFGAFGLPVVFSFRPDQLVTLVFFLMLVLDVPAAPAYYHFDPPTEILGGMLLFNTIGKTFGIPGLSILPLDLVTYSFLFIALFVYMPKLNLLGLRVNEKSLVVRASLLFVAATLLAVVFGRLKGHDSYLIFLQVRFLFYIPAWFIIGFLIFSEESQVHLLIDLLVLAMIIKSLVALYAYFSEIINYPEAEYLVDHHMSIFWSMALVVVFCRAFLWNEHWVGKVLGFCVIALMVYPYILNDRRTSFLGIGFTFAFLTIVLIGPPLKKFLRMLLVGFPIYLIVVTDHFLRNADNNPVDYRDLENFNLYHLISQNPILGIGFGKRFEMIAEMPDISRFYPLYDLIPHNTMLALWGYAGPFAMASLAAMITIGMMAVVHLARNASRWKTRLFAIGTLALTVQWILFMFADLGLVEIRSSSLSMAFLGIAISHSFRLWKKGEFLTEQISTGNGKIIDKDFKGQNDA